MSTTQIRTLETRLFAARDRVQKLTAALQDILAIVNMAPLGAERNALELIADRAMHEVAS